ncbi:unnamed protein product [Mytilus edulis]|uniref:THAP-type domain-containing protein n=1 Tax=Mytilus edulis TaxID=6550 RepID=A0A8S3S382_MYTED|nr:unnamed protein product [Mytilus edulis]
MVNKNCMYGVCKSDSRYTERLAKKDVHFIPFPKPLRNRVKCERWIRACGRPDLNVEKVTKYSYICSLHFVRGNGPTEKYPDPIPAGDCEAEKENFMLQNRKRRAPIDRPSLVCRKEKNQRNVPSVGLPSVNVSDQINHTIEELQFIGFQQDATYYTAYRERNIIYKRSVIVYRR